jgi:hypothetical protein
LARRRVRSIREALEKERSIAQRPVTPAAVEDEVKVSSPRAIEVCINGTLLEVDVIMDEGEDPVSSGCRLKASEKSNAMTSILSVGALDMTSLWAKYISQPLQFEQAVVRVKRVRTANLRSVELMGENDPFVVMSFGDVWSGQTSTIEEGGSDVEWAILSEEQASMQFQATRQELSAHKLQVCVSDENKFRSHTVIGSAEVDVAALLEASAYQHEQDFSVTLRNKNGKDSGRVTVCLDLIKSVVDSGEDKSSRDISKLYSSLQDAWQDRSVQDDFVRFIAEHYVDLFLSRGSSVMILRLKSLT